MLLLLAPIQGITDNTYLSAYAKHIGGIDEMYLPFISGSKITPSMTHTKLKELLPAKKNTPVTIPQILSNKADEIILFSKIIKNLGYQELNWNIGCPFSRIANKKRGCGILPYPDVIKNILDNAFNEIAVDFSIKTRLGFLNPDEIFKVIEILNDYPVKHIILHPRTGLQIYSGNADPDKFSQCLNISNHKLIYNGDIYNTSQYRKLSKILPGQNTWMIGRGIIMNPFLSHEIKGVVFPEDKKRIMLKNFHDEIFNNLKENAKSERKQLGKMKAIWYYMSGLFSEGGQVFNKIKKCKNSNEYIDVIESAINQKFSVNKEQSEYFKNSLKHIGSLTSK